MYDDLVEFLQESVTPFHAAGKLAARRGLHPPGGGRLLEPGAGQGLLCHPERLVCCCVARAGARHRRLAHCGQPQRFPFVEGQE